MELKKKLKRIKKKYKKLVKKYGRITATKMGISYAFYRTFGRVAISVLKKTVHNVKENRIIFETKPDFSDNGRALSDYMATNGYDKNYEIIWLVKEPEKFKEYQKENVKFIPSVGKLHRRRTLKAYYYSLTAKYVFFTHSFRWIQKKVEGQIYVNLWHGCGYKASRRTEGNENVFDYCLVPGEVFIKTKAEFFGCPEEKILPIGYPRYDLYKNDNPKVDEYFASLGDKGRKNILWMPTFVQSKDLIYYENPMPSLIGLPLMNSINDMDRLEEMCKEANVNLIIKRHRIGSKLKASKEEVKEGAHVFYLENKDLDEMGVQLYELIAKSDALITDYSSVAVDYILLDKPIGFTLDSIDDYAKTRGFAFEDPKEYMPGEHLYNLKDLEEFLHHVSEGRDLGKDLRAGVIGQTHNKTEDYCKRILDYFEITC